MTNLCPECSSVMSNGRCWNKTCGPVIRLTQEQIDYAREHKEKGVDIIRLTFMVDDVLKAVGD